MEGRKRGISELWANFSRTNFVKDGRGLPAPGKKGAKVTSKSRFLSQNGSNPVSPALSSARSPSLGPTSIPLSAQQAQHDKAVQKPIIHLLAVEPMSEDDLLASITDIPENELQQAFQKVAILEGTKWALKTKFFKELDVWGFEYEDTDDRQRAIDNAVRVYDKSRLNLNEPEWERLLPKHERGTGKCLSKLQARLATAESGSVRTPKIHVQKADDSGHDTPMGEDGEITGAGRSTSQPPTTKPKKPSEKEAQAKRLLGGKPAKAAVKKATPIRKEKPKEKAKVQPKEKPREKIEKPTGKVLSSQFVNESDDEDNYSAAAPVKKPAPKPLKRSREDDIDTSDSSIPLSKKVKKDIPELIHSNARISDNSKSSQRTTSSTSSQHKYKGTSPHKSSPLASSPPTNASEVDSSSSASPRKPRSPIQKYHHKSSSVASSVSSSSSTRSLKPEVVDMARKYRLYYPKYEALHREVAGLGKRDKEMEGRLLDMHERLARMKSEILEGIIEN